MYVTIVRKYIGASSCVLCREDVLNLEPPLSESSLYCVNCYSVCGRSGENVGLWRCQLVRFSAHLAGSTVNPLLMDTSKIQSPPLTGHHCSAPFHISCIDMYTYIKPQKQGHFYKQDS